MNPGERARLEHEIRNNGGTAEEVGLTVKEMTVLNWHDIQDIKKNMVTKVDLFRLAGLIVLIAGVTIGVIKGI